MSIVYLILSVTLFLPFSKTGPTTKRLVSMIISTLYTYGILCHEWYNIVIVFNPFDYLSVFLTSLNNT